MLNLIDLDPFGLDGRIGPQVEEALAMFEVD